MNTLKVRQMLCWSMLTGGLIALFWISYYIIVGSLPTSGNIHLYESKVMPIPLLLPHWWSILIGPAYSVILILILNSDKLKEYNTLAKHSRWKDTGGFELGLISGLFFGLFGGMIGYLNHTLLGGICISFLGFAFLSMITGFAAASGFLLGAGLGMIFGLSAMFGIVFGLVFSLAALFFLWPAAKLGIKIHISL